MIQGFWQSRMAVYGSAVAAVALSVAIWIYDRGKPLYIPILAILLLTGLCGVVGQMAGRIIADSVNTRSLSFLHVELDPEAFLERYEKVPGRLKKGSKEYVLSCAYLAQGYAATGEFDRAMDVLCSDYSGKKGEDQALKGLYYYSFASYALSGGHLEEAQKAMEGLKEVAEDSRKQNPKLSQNMKECLVLCQNRLACLKGEQADSQWLKGQLKNVPFALRRLEVLETLARQALADGRKKDGLKWLDQMEKQSGKTCYGERARELKKECLSSIGG